MLVVIGGIARTNENAGRAGAAKGTTDVTAGSGAVATAATPEQALPKTQLAFLDVVADYQARFRSASSELQQSASRDERRTALLNAFGSRLTVDGWLGTLHKLETNTEGKAIVTIRLAPNVDLKTWNNALSDVMHETMIEKGTPLYTALMEMAVDDPVMVSGSFVHSDQDGAWETSMTIDGSMTAPEFLFHFSTISKQ
ncbi:hypothetical protein [Shinella sp. M31]|uniref:hypothetical protein n=1 Tax=Shinella sp. M31 TaxID=3368615 RepID=UPI003B9E9F78